MSPEMKKFLQETNQKVQCKACLLQPKLRREIEELKKAGASVPQVSKWIELKAEVVITDSSIKRHFRGHR